VGSREEAGWVGTRVERFLRDGSYLPDPDAARVLVALSDPGIHHAVAVAMDRVNRRCSLSCG
jgi:hypothetical protein